MDDEKNITTTDTFVEINDDAKVDEENNETSVSPDYVEMTLNSGVAPLEMRFAQINSCYSKTPVAYRSFTYINSVTEGVIPPEKYSFAADGTDRGIRLAKWNIAEAIKSIRAFEKEGRNIRFVTARVPARITLEVDVYDWMKEILKENQFDEPEKLCLEFAKSSLYEDSEKVRAALLSLKLLKVKTLLTGCGDKDCPITCLLDLPFDMALLSPWLTSLVDSRSKAKSVISLVEYLRSLSIEVMGDGVYNDEQITALNRIDCFGYIPSSGYHGSVEHGRLRMTIKEALIQKEEGE